MENVTQNQTDNPEFLKFQGELKKVFDDVNEQMKSHGANVDKALKNYETFSEEIKSLKESMTKLETKTNAPMVTTPEQNKELLKKEFREYLTKGSKKYYEHLGDIDKEILTKTLSTQVDSSGGALIPIVYQREMIKLESNYCPMMELARVIPMTEGDVLEVPIQGATRMGVAVTSERESRTETTNPTVGKKRIQVYDYEARILTTNKLISDSMFPLEEFLNQEYAAQVGTQFGSDCVVGTGAAGPKGFTNETVQSVLSGASGALDLKTIPLLMLKVKPAYRVNGKWAANGTTIGTIWGLAATNYLSVVSVNPATGNLSLFGKDMVEMAELPDIGSSAYPLYFGDWSRACWVVNRADVELIRNPYDAANMGNTWFYYKVRRGFALMNAEAIAKMKSNNS